MPHGSHTCPGTSCRQRAPFTQTSPHGTLLCFTFFLCTLIPSLPTNSNATVPSHKPSLITKVSSAPFGALFMLVKITLQDVLTCQSPPQARASFTFTVTHKDSSNPISTLEEKLTQWAQ